MTLFSLSVLATLVATATAASLQPVKNFGANPGGVAMHIYVPDNVKPNAAVILSVRNPMSFWNTSEKYADIYVATWLLRFASNGVFHDGIVRQSRS
jgi:hypothetical protein